MRGTPPGVQPARASPALTWLGAGLGAHRVVADVAVERPAAQGDVRSERRLLPRGEGRIGDSEGVRQRRQVRDVLGKDVGDAGIRRVLASTDLVPLVVHPGPLCPRGVVCCRHDVGLDDVVGGVSVGEGNRSGAPRYRGSSAPRTGRTAVVEGVVFLVDDDHVLDGRARRDDGGRGRQGGRGRLTRRETERSSHDGEPQRTDCGLAHGLTMTIGFRSP